MEMHCVVPGHEVGEPSAGLVKRGEETGVADRVLQSLMPGLDKGVEENRASSSGFSLCATCRILPFLRSRRPCLRQFWIVLREQILVFF